ncbi:hypothetical protein NY056_03340 [Corynebacterium diphtheriae bv. gravis]|nr:hypothetical protein NY056_03340 [Corynebacterium diphtheriae bv. gravis]
MKKRRKRDEETRGGGGGEISEVVDVRDDAVAVGVDTQWLVDFSAGEVLEFPRRGGVAEGGYAMPADDEFRGRGGGADAEGAAAC